MKKLSNVHVLKPCPEASVEVIKALAESYTGSGHDAPVVIGHPKDNSPAYGWVEALRETEGNLYADLEVQDSLYDLIEKKVYPKRSVSFYLSEPPLFRHLGLLGGQPPQVKGLEDIQLSESDSQLVTIDILDEPEPDSTDLSEPEIGVEQDKEMNIIPTNTNEPMNLKHVALFNLSESLPGITAKSFKQEPTQDDSGNISGIVSLGDKEYTYTLTQVNDDNYTVDTTLVNGEVVTLSERVRELEDIVSRQKTVSQVTPLHESKLTPKIISLSELVELVEADSTGLALKLVQNLPEIVDMSESDTEDVGNEIALDESNSDPIAFAKTLITQYR